MEEAKTRALIRLFRKTRSQKALQVLVVNHQAAIKLAASYIPDKPFDMSDKQQMGSMILMKAVSKGGFDLRRKNRFVSYLIPMVQRRIIDEVRKYYKKHKGEILRQVSFDESYMAAVGEDPTHSYEIEEQKNMIIEQIQRLPRTEQIIMGCIMNGMKQKDIAKQAGVSDTRISQIVNGCIKKIQQNVKFH